MVMNSAELAAYIDRTLLKPDTVKDDTLKLCAEAREYGFASVCVNPFWVPLCAQELENARAKVCTVIGFPLGANCSSIKALETKEAIANGADEIDMVINIGAAKSGAWQTVEADITAVVSAASEKLVKAILETSLLDKDEIVKACKVAQKSGW